MQTTFCGVSLLKLDPIKLTINIKTSLSKQCMLLIVFMKLVSTQECAD